MYHPSRGGVRGGADQFEWDSVKSDKHRENYLGHSLMAPVGRWQKNKDLQWFSRDKKGKDLARSEEKDAIKRMEAEAMAAALGHAPVKKVQTQQLTRQELEEVCKKGQTERDEKDIERIEGMGFGSNRASLMDTLSSNTKETLSAVGSSQDNPRVAKQNTETAQSYNSPREERKASKKNKKKEKKEKRKHKKKKSKEQKESKKTHGRNDSVSSVSEDERISKKLNQRTRHDSDSGSENEHSLRKQQRHKRHDSESSYEDQQSSRKPQRPDSSNDYHTRDSTMRKQTYHNTSRKQTVSGGHRQRHDSSSHDCGVSRKVHKITKGDGGYLSKVRHDSFSDVGHSTTRNDSYSRNKKQSSHIRHDSSDDDSRRPYKSARHVYSDDYNSRRSKKRKETKQSNRKRHNSSSEDDRSDKKRKDVKSSSRKRDDSSLED